MHDDLQPPRQVMEGDLTDEFSVGSDAGWARWGFHISLDYAGVQTAAGFFLWSGTGLLHLSKQILVHVNKH